LEFPKNHLELPREKRWAASYEILPKSALLGRKGLSKTQQKKRGRASSRKSGRKRPCMEHIKRSVDTGGMRKGSRKGT